MDRPTREEILALKREYLGKFVTFQSMRYGKLVTDQVLEVTDTGYLSGEFGDGIGWSRLPKDVT